MARIPILESEVGTMIHNRYVGDIVMQIVRVMPSVPDRLVLLSSVVSGVLHMSSKQENLSMAAMLEVVLSEVAEQIVRLEKEGKKT